MTVNAIAGTHVVTLGLDLDESRRLGCLGFAIQREDHTEDERYWLSGMMTFAETDPGLGPGGQVSSRYHPYQTFRWADYSAKPAHDYTHRVYPVYGTPTALHLGPWTTVSVTTESEAGESQSVFFNRGSVATQGYARRFQDKATAELVGAEQDAAYGWLSRGLLEALVAFIGRASGPEYGLYGAIYESQWAAALEALKAVVAAGATVRVTYDAISGDSGPRAKNEAAIAAAGVGEHCLPRTTGTIMHNKFLVLISDDAPVAVWTGSTNWTENGIFGHMNCGHSIEDEAIAAEYLAYWQELTTNPKARPSAPGWGPTTRARRNRGTRMSPPSSRPTAASAS